MLKKRRGEIATLLTLGLVLVGTLITLGTSLFVNKTKIASNPRAAGEVTRYGSMNCTPSQICGNYANYVPGSQYQQGSVRVVKCKDGSIPASPSSCIVSLTGVPPTITPNPDSPSCTSGAYTLLVDCENICGINNCQSCKLGSVTKYECKVGTSVPQCTASMTYASVMNCQSASCNDCRQCHLAGDTAVRYECGGTGPTMAPYATPTSPPAPTKTPTPIASKTPTPIPCVGKSITCNTNNSTHNYYKKNDPTNCPDNTPNYCFGTNINSCDQYGWNGIYNFLCGTTYPTSAAPTRTPKLYLCTDGITIANCTFGNSSDLSTGPGVCNGLTEDNIKGCNPIPSNKKCSDFNGNIYQCVGARVKYSCFWYNSTKTCDAINTCSTSSDFICVDIPFGGNAIKACSDYPENYNLYISTTNPKSCGNNKKACCQLDQFAANNTCVNADHTCVNKNIPETDQSACQRNGQTPVTDGTTCGDSTKACCQGVGLTSPFTSSNCSQPINCPAGFSGIYYSKSITYTATQEKKTIYFASQQNCTNNVNYQATVESIRQIVCQPTVGGNTGGGVANVNLNQGTFQDLVISGQDFNLSNQTFEVGNTIVSRCKQVALNVSLLNLDSYFRNHAMEILQKCATARTFPYYFSNNSRLEVDIQCCH